MENKSNNKIVHIVSNHDFFYLLFKTFVQQIDKECKLQKIEHVHVAYNKNENNSENLPNLIIIDANIDRISPIDLVNILRSDMHYQMPIWFVTEIVAEQYVSKMKDVGANRIISKPFDPEELALEIVNILNYNTTNDEIDF
jgi:DNA-binding response OmpR family regulator